VGPQRRRQCQGGVRDVRTALYRSDLRVKIPYDHRSTFVG
jgi:hypothetical protein